MRRFYKAVTVQPAAGHQVLLDGRPVRTPAKKPLDLPTAALAAAVAEEWAAQGEEIRPQTMPLTQIACTALDLVCERREAVIEELADFAGTELLCYRADRPRDLVERQQQVWQPLLDWAALAHDASLRVTSGVVAVEQSSAALRALRQAVAGHDDMALSALAAAVRATGSLVIGLALAAGRLGAEDAFEAAELDESYSLEQWGDDKEAQFRRDALKAELAATRRFFDLLAA